AALESSNENADTRVLCSRDEECHRNPALQATKLVALRHRDRCERRGELDMSAAAVRDVVDLPPESLVVLTHDTELLQTLRAVATEHEISTVGAESDLAAHLLEDHAGVAVLDTAAVTTPIGPLADRLKSQFPDLVLVVAGHASEQSALAARITRGTVYRFLHKPVSEQRVRL